MNLVKILANRINYGSKRNTNNIKWLVIHYTANDGDSAKGNGNYFKNNKPKASAHYFVDDNVIVNSVPDNYTAYAVGGKKYNNNGGKYYGVCTNSNSISIELCDTERNGKSDLSEKTRTKGEQFLDSAARMGENIKKAYDTYQTIAKVTDALGLTDNLASRKLGGSDDDKVTRLINNASATELYKKRGSLTAAQMAEARKRLQSEEAIKKAAEAEKKKKKKP